MQLGIPRNEFILLMVHEPFCFRINKRIVINFNTSGNRDGTGYEAAVNGYNDTGINIQVS